MYKRLFVTLVFILGGMGDAMAEYKLVWSDEFDSESLDESNWNRDAFPGVDSGNYELQHYTRRPENSFIEDGNLVIEARKESFKGHDYTSARLTTKGKQEFKYGRIEARIKLPRGNGMWPAFWMMPAKDVYGGWAASGEIDIMESINVPDHIFGTIHFGGGWPENVYQGNRYDGPEGKHIEDFSTDYHVFAIEWQPYEMRWYVDGELYSIQNSWSTKGHPFPAPFDQEFYLILNIAVGGRLPAPPDETTEWPQRMLIDWVRVYQTDNQAPALEVLQPKSDSKNPAGEPISFKVEVSDPDDNIDRVEYYNHETLLAAVKEAPYAFDWDAPDGFYHVKVRAFDEEGFAVTRKLDVIQGKGRAQAPFGGTPAAIPGQIEAENFDDGMPKDAFLDTNVLNEGSASRKDTPVDVEYCGEGGYNVGWIRDGEWLEYTVDVAEEATYDLVFRTASTQPGGQIRLLLNDKEIVNKIDIPATAGWHAYADVVHTGVELPAGEHILRLEFPVGQFNLNWYKVLPEGKVRKTIDVLDYVRAAGLASGSTLDEACYGEKITWFWDQYFGFVDKKWPELAGLVAGDTDFDGGGIPDNLELALAAAALCSTPEAEQSFVQNHNAVQGMVNEGPWWGRPVAIGLMSAISPAHIQAIGQWDTAYTKLPMKAHATKDGTAHPLSPEGDFDGDGKSNLEEYIALATGAEE